MAGENGLKRVETEPMMAKSDIFSGQAALKSEVFLLLIVGVAAS